MFSREENGRVRNTISQALRKSWDQKLSIRVKSLGQAVDVGTVLSDTTFVTFWS